MITLITVDLHPIYPQHALTSGHHHRPLQASQVGHIHVLCVFCQVGVIDKKRLKRPRFESITGPSSCNLPLHRLSRFCRTVFGSGSILMSACIGRFIFVETWLVETTHRVIKVDAWLELPVSRCAKSSDIIFNKQILVFWRIDLI